MPCPGDGAEEKDCLHVDYDVCKHILIAGGGKGVSADNTNTLTETVSLYDISGKEEKK